MNHHLYPHGQHPFWCELLDGSCGTDEEPHHIGRTSTMFAQTDEARIQLQFVRPDERVPAGTRPGAARVKLTVDENVTQTRVWLSRDEAQTLALLMAQYVDMLDRENLHPESSTTEQILNEEMYAGDRR